MNLKARIPGFSFHLAGRKVSVGEMLRDFQSRERYIQVEDSQGTTQRVELTAEEFDRLTKTIWMVGYSRKLTMWEKMKLAFRRWFE